MSECSDRDVYWLHAAAGQRFIPTLRAAIAAKIGPGGGAGGYTGSYVIETSDAEENFVINGESFEAKTYCVDMEEGDVVTFLEGNPFAACVDAKLLNRAGPQRLDHRAHGVAARRRAPRARGRRPARSRSLGG
jgi:hypothetical protein